MLVEWIVVNKSYFWYICNIQVEFWYFCVDKYSQLVATKKKQQRDIFHLKCIHIWHMELVYRFALGIYYPKAVGSKFSLICDNRIHNIVCYDFSRYQFLNRGLFAADKLLIDGNNSWLMRQNSMNFCLNITPLYHKEIKNDRWPVRLLSKCVMKPWDHIGVNKGSY